MACLNDLLQLQQRFDRHQGLLRASALSFDTSLGLVPLLALLFIGLQQLGVHQQLAPYLLQQVAGNSPEAAARILEYIDRIRFGSLGLLGLVGLLISLFSLLEGVREAFNGIWETQEQRGLLRRCRDYAVLVLAAPLLLTVALGGTSLLQSRWVVQWLAQQQLLQEGIVLLLRLTSFCCTVLVLLVSYLLVPTVRVTFRSALHGALLAGLLWQLAHWAYFHFQFGVARYNAMYGALALLPFLLIWIYTSWVLVLLGMELTCRHQQTCGASQSLPAETTEEI